MRENARECDGPWRQDAVIYEIALISFHDSEGDGKGDLSGLLPQRDYLEWLGIDAMWLMPIQKTPFRDFGYDLWDFMILSSAPWRIPHLIVEGSGVGRAAGPDRPIRGCAFVRRPVAALCRGK